MKLIYYLQIKNKIVKKFKFMYKNDKNQKTKENLFVKFIKILLFS